MNPSVASAPNWPVLDHDVIKILVIGGLVVFGILGYAIITMIGNVLESRAREQTKRDVAAYVSEGTMTPETAHMILGSEAKKPWEQQVAELIARGSIDSKEAEKLLRAGPKSSEAVTAPVAGVS